MIKSKKIYYLKWMISKKKWILKLRIIKLRFNNFKKKEMKMRRFFLKRWMLSLKSFKMLWFNWLKLKILFKSLNSNKLKAVLLLLLRKKKINLLLKKLRKKNQLLLLFKINWSPILILDTKASPAMQAMSNNPESNLIF